MSETRKPAETARVRVIREERGNGMNGKNGERRVITPEEGLRNRETLMRIWRDIQKQKRQARGGR